MRYLFFFFLFYTSELLPQNKINEKLLYSEFALKASRANFRAELEAKIKNTFSSTLNSKAEKEWASLLSEVALMLYKTDDVHQAIKTASEYALNGSTKFQHSVVEAIITLYPNEFNETIDSLFNSAKDPTLYSYLVHYYLNQNSSNKNYFIEETKKRFGNWEKVPQLKFLIYYLQNDNVSTPPLKELLSHNFMEGKTIIYSLQRKDRRYPGITIIKGPNGEFVKRENDSIFYVQQLALSVTNLPGYLSQGNTPQGIFSVVGFYNSPTPSIGPTAAVLTRIPFEVPIKLWYHSAIDKTRWDIEDYKNLLPESWKDYLPMYESYYAGKTGRRKIVMHGSVDDLSFYDKLPYFPLTPSKGCLTTVEFWSEETGKNIRSDQAKLMNAFFSTGELTGFLIVVDIDNKNKPLSIEEILPFIDN